MKILIHLPVLVVLLWLSCAQDTVRGGSGTETTDSFAYLASGAPASNCKVFLIDQANWMKHALSGDYIVDSATAAEDGLFAFRNTGSYRNKLLSIQFDHDSAGLCRKSIYLDDLDTSTFVLSRYSELTGTVRNAQHSAVLRIEGTTYRTTVDADGSFSFKKIPPGNWAVIAEDVSGLHSAGTVPVPADTIVDATLDGQWNDRFLVTDFECGFTAPLAEASGISPFWYLFSDSTSKGYDFETGRWVVDTSDDFTKSGNSFIDAYVKMTDSDGRRLFIDGTLDQNCSFPYIGIGLVLYTEGNNGINLQDADAIQFEVSGTGTARLIFLAKHPEYNSKIRFSSIISLTSENEVVSIDLSSLEINEQTEDSVKISWTEASSHVLMIEFAFYDSENSDASAVNAVIDNIALKGTDIEGTIGSNSTE
jgi:hypothetical protein